MSSLKKLVSIRLLVRRILTKQELASEMERLRGVQIKLMISSFQVDRGNSKISSKKSITKTILENLIQKLRPMEVFRRKEIL